MSSAAATPWTTGETCALPTVQRIAGMLGLGPEKYAEGEVLPDGWHFFLLAALTPRQNLREDGFPGFGVPMPDLGLPRLLLRGRAVEYLDPLIIGTQVQRTSAIVDVARTTNDKDDRAILTIRHELRTLGKSVPAIVETQTYALLPAGGSFQERRRGQQIVRADKIKSIVPDATLLFQFSALGFNSHRIHLDRDYARDVEGYPDLVVNGGLTTLLTTEFIRCELGLKLRTITMKNTAALFAGRPMLIAGVQSGDAYQVSVHDDLGHLAASIDLQLA
jgi:3-methylfumaryl-CoA hydratase